MAEEKTIHIGTLKPDEHNPRKHNPRNIGMIVDSLHEVGAARSIVIDEDDNILAGNGTVEAAGEVGMERVKVVEANGNELVAVRRRGLTKEQKRRLALFDNRTAELAAWDPLEVQGIVDDGISLDGIFTDDEATAMLTGDEAESGPARVKPISTKESPPMTWVLIGIPTVRFGTIAERVESIASLSGVVCEMTVADDADDEG